MKSAFGRKEADLIEAIGTYELLVAIARSKNPDFDFIDEDQVQDGLRECQLCLCRIKRVELEEMIHTKRCKGILKGIDSECEDLANEIKGELHQVIEAAFNCSSTYSANRRAQALMELVILMLVAEREQEARHAYTEAVAIIQSSESIDMDTHQIMHRVDERLKVSNSNLDACIVAKCPSTEQTQCIQEVYIREAGSVDKDLTKSQLSNLIASFNVRPTLSDDELHKIWTQMTNSDPIATNVSYSKILEWCSYT